ncbi:MAG: adenine phosphoribosyltransferase [Spirochaetales bacterium]|nr:adenine phosphoribosyltransferase [Spirochaetales bacterium]
MPAEYDLDAAIRKIPDFPRPGILFYDVTGILTTPAAFRFCVDRIVERYRDRRLGGVAAIEARGFVFAAPAAYTLGVPLIVVRKKGKLPGPTYTARFTLEYGEDEIEVHRSDLVADTDVLVVDDLIATGGTLKAACSLVEQAGARVAGIFGVVGLPFLNYDRVLGGYPVDTLIQYHGE